MINCLELISHENLIIALVLLLLGLFLVLYSWVFVFFLTPPPCSLQFILQWCAWLLSSHSSKAPLSIIWCSQLKLRKAFGPAWLILPPQPLFCSAEMFPLCLHAHDRRSFQMSHWTYAPCYLNNPLFHQDSQNAGAFHLFPCQNGSKGFPHPMW